jgi:hypothetical protein
MVYANMKCDIEHKKTQQIAKDTQQTSRNWYKTMIKILCMKGYVTIIKCCANKYIY